MNCPRCKNDEVCRTPRRSIWDNVKASMGWWPYRCAGCRRRFVAARRYAPDRESQPKRQSREQTGQKQPEQEQRRGAGQAGPEIAFRSDPVRPMAKVVIQADDHVQLDKILMALHLAVSSYQQPARERATAATH